MERVHTTNTVRKLTGFNYTVRSLDDIAALVLALGAERELQALLTQLAGDADKLATKWALRACPDAAAKKAHAQQRTGGHARAVMASRGL